MATTEIDATPAEAFAGRMLEILNDGMLTLLLSIGHQTGLFDTLASVEPATSEELARRRRARRALRARVARRDDGRRHRRARPRRRHVPTPAARARGLPDARRRPEQPRLASPQYTALFGELEQQVVDCFRNGGGVPLLGDAALPGAAGGGVRPDPRRRPDRRHAAARRRARRPAPRRHRRDRRRLRSRPRRQPDRRRVPRQPRHRHRHLRARHRRRAGRGGASCASTNAASRCGTRCSLEPARTTSSPRSTSIHDLPQPAETARGDPRRAPAGRRLPDGRHRRVEPPAREPRAPARPGALHRLDLPLHDRLARERRARARHDVGRADGARAARARPASTTSTIERVEADFINAYYIASKP